MNRYMLLVGWLVFLSAASVPLVAKPVDPVSFTLQLIPAHSPTQEYLDVKLVFHIESGWKILHPDGQAVDGIAPRITTDQGKNIRDLTITWPQSKRPLRDGASVTMRVYPHDSKIPVDFIMRIVFSICREECRFFDEKLATLLPSLQDYQRGITSLPPVPLKEVMPSVGGSIGIILLMALLGGFILNFMPCVLPVLSLKLMALTKGDFSRESVVRKSLATFAGLMVSFWLLAVAVIFLRKFGVHVGWGMHFQQPVFVGIMMIVLIIFSLNMFGVFEFRLPLFMGINFSRFRDTLWRDFGLGFLATVLATPCSAPFLGTAVGYALTHDAATIVAVFTFLGVGFGIPYLVIILKPTLYHYLPRPGPWMQRLRIILGASLLVTVIWLSTVLVGEIQTENTHSGESTVIDAKKRIHIFSQILLDTLIAEGKTVFVDITARWCVTCIANKKFILSDSRLIQDFKDQQVFILQGDWTRPSSEITRFINNHGRYGIPFNAIYSPKCPHGYVFPEVLTVEAIRSRVKMCR
ncbi:MAG: thioredoxin family protein [Alphaproteobacteria bacterium]|nr:MAG: thioredoxin family protein [Alphaproteobacteria bacterium]